MWKNLEIQQWEGDVFARNKQASKRKRVFRPKKFLRNGQHIISEQRWNLYKQY